MTQLSTFPRRLSGPLAAALLAAITQSARADADDYVFVPYAVEGARYVQYAGGVQKYRDGGSAQAQSVLFGLSPTPRWFTAAYAGWYRAPGDTLQFGALSWLNHVALIEPGSSPFELGIYLKIERPRDRSQGYEITWGPTLQADLGHYQVNANLWLRKGVRTEDAGPTQSIYQWQVKRLWRPHLELGAQGFGTLGPWLDWLSPNRQEHLLGPAVFAKVPVGEHREMEISVAALVGITSQSARGALRVRALYTF